MPDMHDLRRKKNNGMSKNCLWLLRTKTRRAMISIVQREISIARCDKSGTLDMTSLAWCSAYAISIAAEL